MDKLWYLYIVQCRDGKLYTGVSNDVERRVDKHNKGEGCRFTKYRYPVTLLYKELCGTNSAAQRREQLIKSFRKQEKLQLMNKKSNLLKKGSVSQRETSAGETEPKCLPSVDILAP